MNSTFGELKNNENKLKTTFFKASNRSLYIYHWSTD